MSLLGCWVNRYRAMHGTYNGARTRLLSYSAYYGNVRPMCGNIRQCAVCYYTQCSAIFCQGSAIFCQGRIVRSGWNVVGTGGRVQGVTGWSRDRYRDPTNLRLYYFYLSIYYLPLNLEIL